jgi:hypothetical protein
MGGRYGSRRSTETGRYNRYQERMRRQNDTRRSVFGRHGNGNGNNGSFRHGHGNRNGRNGSFRNRRGNGTRKSFMGGFFEKFASEIKKIAN